MAINILTEPTDPPIAGDFTLDQAIQHAAETPQLSILTTWESTGAAPAAKQGAFIRHAGNTFQVQSSDEAISGSVTAGLNYIIATEAAGVITLAWATTLTGYSYNPAYGGIYDSSGNQALRDLCYLDGSDYLRGMSFGEDFNYVRLANGNVIATGGINFTSDITISGDITIGNYITHGKAITSTNRLVGSVTEAALYTWISQFVTSENTHVILNGMIYSGTSLVNSPAYASYINPTQIGIQGGTTTSIIFTIISSGGGINYTVVLTV